MKKLGALIAWSITIIVQANVGFVDYDIKWTFPAELGGFSYNFVEKYDNPSLGYTLFFEKRGPFEIDISVCDLDTQTITDGADPAVLDVVFSCAESALHVRENDEEITSITPKVGKPVPEKAPLQFGVTHYHFMEKTYKLIKGNEVEKLIPRVQSVYATALKNNFVIFKMSYAKADAKNAAALANKVLADLTKTIQKEASEKELLLASCDVFLADPTTYSGQMAAQYFMAKAQTMGNLTLHPQLFAWPDGFDKPDNADLLVAGYFAGMMQVVVPDDLDDGGTYEAFNAMLETYLLLRSKDLIEEIPSLKEWIANPNRTALFESLTKLN